MSSLLIRGGTILTMNDRLDIDHWRNDVAGFEQAMRAMGEITGWDNLRSSGPSRLCAHACQSSGHFLASIVLTDSLRSGGAC